MGSDITPALRSQVARRARHRCEYCLIHENDTAFRPQIDHILSRKHGGDSAIANLAYACVLCNRRKGSDVASLNDSGNIERLYDPRQDRWSDHFRIVGSSIQATSEVGVATVTLLQFNAPERLAERGILQVLGTYPIER